MTTKHNKMTSIFFQIQVCVKVSFKNFLSHFAALPTVLNDF